MGYCPTELKAGRWAGRGSRMGAGLGVLGAGLGVQARAHGRWARWASGRAAGARGTRARAAGGRHGRAAGRHAGRGRRAGHGRLGGLSAAWACSWARLGVLVHSALGSVLTRFLDPVRLGIFLSH